MFSKKKHPSQKRRPSGGSKIDARKSELAAREEKIRAQIEKNQRLLEEAPKLVEAKKRQQREEFIRRASRTEGRYGVGPKLPDPRGAYHAAAALAPLGRRGRQTRRRGMVIFFLLLGVLAAVWCYIASLVALG